MEYRFYYHSPLGVISMASDGSVLTGLTFTETENEKDPARKNVSFPVFQRTKEWLDVYFKGFIPDFTPPFRLDGTPFQKAVWEKTLAVPYGKTITYGEIARLISADEGGKMISAQAVGGALGHNPILLIVPCHRVVGKRDENGYAAGKNRKTKLLRLEKTCLENIFDRA